jgi:hypothetical protein
MAGAIAAHRNMLGTAPRVGLLTVRAFSANVNSAQGTTFNILKGIDWAAGQQVHPPPDRCFASVSGWAFRLRVVPLNGNRREYPLPASRGWSASSPRPCRQAGFRCCRCKRSAAQSLSWPAQSKVVPSVSSRVVRRFSVPGFQLTRGRDGTRGCAPAARGVSHATVRRNDAAIDGAPQTDRRRRGIERASLRSGAARWSLITTGRCPPARAKLNQRLTGWIALCRSS